jgi:hypothetical protein
MIRVNPDGTRTVPDAPSDVEESESVYTLTQINFALFFGIAVHASQRVAEGPSRAQLELEDSSAVNPLSRHWANARPASSRRIMSPATDACATGHVLLYHLPTERSLHQRRTACNEG